MNTNAAQIDDGARLLPGVIFSQRPDFTFSFVSPKVAEFTGLSAAEWSRQPAEHFWEIIHEADAESLRKQLGKAAHSDAVITSTFRLRNLNTKQITCIEERRQAVRDQTGSLLRYDCLWLDVTQQLQSEQLRVGIVGPDILTRLADVLVHDFNNCMTGIHALCEIIRSSIEPGHPFHESLDLLRQNTNRANQIIHRMADLAGRNTGTRAIHNLNDLLTDGLELAHKIASSRIRIETTLVAESLPVYVDAAEFRQVVIKLIVNAVNNMPQGGALRFETSRHAEYSPATHRSGDWPRLPSFCLAVTDTGNTSRESLSEIFHPFSTNKPLTQDHDTGLYAVSEAVKKFGGAITVEVEEGKSRTFRVWLPEADFTESDAR